MKTLWPDKSASHFNIQEGWITIEDREAFIPRRSGSTDSVNNEWFRQDSPQASRQLIAVMTAGSSGKMTGNSGEPGSGLIIATIELTWGWPPRISRRGW